MVERLLRRAARARRENRLDDAKQDLVTAVADLRRRTPGVALGRALAGLGQIERDLGHDDAARVHYQEAVSIYRVEGDVLELAHALRHLGDIHQDAGRLNLAASSYEEALDFYRRNVLARKSDLANALRSMAIHKESIGEWDRARLCWEEARKVYASLDGPLQRLLGRPPNPGVVESTERLARLAERA